MTLMSPDPQECRLVALGHPSLDHSIQQFATELRSEQRFFGLDTVSKPSRSMVERLVSPAPIRLATMVGRRLIAVSRVGERCELDIAVVADWRRRGVASALLHDTVLRAGCLGHERIVLRSSRRSRPVAAIGRWPDATIVDYGDGRLDLILTSSVLEHSG